MFLGKRIQLRCAKIPGQHGAAKGDDVMKGQQAKLNHREIAVSTQQQRVLLLTAGESVPVDGFQ
ncbi:hypothetical protein D3C85_1871900 [compost metagenome]